MTKEVKKDLGLRVQEYQTQMIKAADELNKGIFAGGALINNDMFIALAADDPEAHKLMDLVIQHVQGAITGKGLFIDTDELTAAIDEIVYE